MTNIRIPVDEAQVSNGLELRLLSMLLCPTYFAAAFNVARVSTPRPPKEGRATPIIIPSVADDQENRYKCTACSMVRSEGPWSVSVRFAPAVDITARELILQIHSVRWICYAKQREVITPGSWHFLVVLPAE